MEQVHRTAAGYHALGAGDRPQVRADRCAGHQVGQKNSWRPGAPAASRAEHPFHCRAPRCPRRPPGRSLPMARAVCVCIESPLGHSLCPGVPAGQEPGVLPSPGSEPGRDTSAGRRPGNNAAKRSAAGYRDRRALAPSTVPAQGPRAPATGAVALSGARLHAGASAEINPRHALTPPSESPCVNGPGMTSAGGLLVRLPLAVAAKRQQVAVPS
jgi:hypothetical protein